MDICHDRYAHVNRIVVCIMDSHRSFVNHAMTINSQTGFIMLNIASIIVHPNAALAVGGCERDSDSPGYSRLYSRNAQ